MKPDILSRRIDLKPVKPDLPKILLSPDRFETIDVYASAEASPDYYFKINDWVKLKNYSANKFEFSWKGPYAVVDVGFPGTYWLMDTNGRRLDSTVNQRDLAPWLSGINDNQSYFHDGTKRSSNSESTDEPLDVYISTLYDRYMGDCVIS